MRLRSAAVRRKLSDAEAERMPETAPASGLGAGRDGPLEDVAQEEDGLTDALGATNDLFAFFLGTGAGEEP